MSALVIFVISRKVMCSPQTYFHEQFQVNYFSGVDWTDNLKANCLLVFLHLTSCLRMALSCVFQNCVVHRLLRPNHPLRHRQLVSIQVSLNSFIPLIHIHVVVSFDVAPLPKYIFSSIIYWELNAVSSKLVHDRNLLCSSTASINCLLHDLSALI